MSDSTNSLIQRVRDAVAGTHEVLGPLGTDHNGELLFLAREIPTGLLVGVAIRQNDPDGRNYAIEVRRTLGQSVSVQGSVCPECGTPLPELDRFCFQCGADLSGGVAPEGTAESDRLLQALAAATTGVYEILGRMDREGGTGAVYFARDLANGKIVALRLRRAEPGDVAQAEFVAQLTRVFKAPSGQVPPATPAYSPPPPPPAAAPPSYAYAANAGLGASLETGEPYAAALNTAPPAYAPPAFSPTNDAQPARSSAKPVWMRGPVLAGAGGVLVVVLALFAWSSSRTASTTATAPDTSQAATIAPPATAARPDSSRVTQPNAAATPLPNSAGTSVSASTDSGTLRIVTELPAGARVTVDGKTVRGRSVRVSARSHQLAITARGYENFSQRVNVAAGSEVQWAPKLVATVATTAPTTPAPSTAPAPGSAPSPRKTCKDAVRREDWSGAMEVCTTEAGSGDAFAASSLGRMYLRGLGTKADAAQSYTWYAKAANGGDHDAQTALGYALRDGNGVKRDREQSVHWFRLAAEAGDRAAQLEYAVALEKGDGTNRDQKAARDWYKKSADQGAFMSARRLARMMEKGDGGAKSDADAAVMYERAAALGDAESAMTIAKWYRDGRGVTKSTAQALVWFKKAAELGDRDADGEIRKLQKG